MLGVVIIWFFFFQAEDGIRDAQESRGLGDVYKRQCDCIAADLDSAGGDDAVTSGVCAATCSRYDPLVLSLIHI